MKTIRKPEFVTFTGVDVRTSWREVRRLSSRYPVEWGILVSSRMQGHGSPRFPGRHIAEKLARLPVASAVHLCGEAARVVSAGRELRDLPISGGGRVQINHVPPAPVACAQFAAATKRTVIAQTPHPGSFPQERCVSWLYDPSAGAGVRPQAWPRHPGHDTLVGYAGGIGPHNVIAVLAEIDSDGPYWIDMETHVRTDEWLDLAKCRAVLEQVYGKR